MEIKKKRYAAGLKSLSSRLKKMALHPRSNGTDSDAVGRQWGKLLPEITGNVENCAIVRSPFAEVVSRIKKTVCRNAR